MKSITIAGIPAGVVNNHNEVLYYWINSKIRNATLFRVDAHHDMCDSYKINKILFKQINPSDYGRFHIANFNCPAVQQGIIDSIYWHNPHSSERNLQDLGTTRKEVERRRIGITIIDHSGCFFSEQVCRWDESVRDELLSGIGKIISPMELVVPTNGKLIVDFDLDGFCCDRSSSIDFCSGSDGYFRKDNPYDGVSNFEKRIDEPIALLKLLPRPDLITIAKSLGNCDPDLTLVEKYLDNCFAFCYVPVDKVDQVQECLIEKLKQIY
ncbi:MAG: UPF0489 family protein [Nanoarchaeota archaeon]